MKIKAWIILAICLFNTQANALIKIGTVFFNPPYVFSLNEGFDIDLSQMLCKGLQEQCQLIPMDYSALFPALINGTIDIAIGGISIPFKRPTRLHF